MEDILRQAESDDAAKNEDVVPAQSFNHPPSPDIALEDGEVDEQDNMTFSKKDTGHPGENVPVRSGPTPVFYVSRYPGPKSSAGTLFRSTEFRASSYRKECGRCFRYVESCHCMFRSLTWRTSFVTLATTLTGSRNSFPGSRSNSGEHEDGLLVGWILLRTIRCETNGDTAIRKVTGTEDTMMICLESAELSPRTMKRVGLHAG